MFQNIKQNKQPIHVFPFRITLPAKQLVLISGLLFGSTTIPEIVVSETAFNDGYFYFTDAIGYVQVSFYLPALLATFL